MAYTWGEIQLESIKKMFLNNDNIKTSDLRAMRNDNKYKIYLNAMPQAANEGILECMKRGRPYIKTVEFTNRPLKNALTDTFKTKYHFDDEIIFESDGGLSYYFEVDAKAEVEIQVKQLNEWNSITIIKSKSREPGYFVSYKNFLPDNTGVRIIFKGDNVYSFRNIAIYTENYDQMNGDTRYIPDYKPYNIVNLVKLADDFYKIDKLYFENYNHLLENRTDYILEDSGTLVLDNRLIGNFILKYQAYPDKIEEDTDDDDELKLHDEVAVLLPLYIASQLYKDDDIALATIYRNEFESAIVNTYPRKEDAKFINKSGWL